jgi:hypothetical protein
MKRLCCVVAGTWVAAAALAAPASAPKVNGGDGPAACQKAAQNALRDTRGDVEEVHFVAPPSVQASTSSDEEFNFKGAGRYRIKSATAREFSYSCNYNTHNGAVAGVVLREAPAGDPAVASRSVAVAALAEPDLSHVSPQACESAAAMALQRRHPKVERISFNTELRQLRQESLTHGNLHGQGTAVRAPGDPSTHFSYQCEFDPRNGRVLSVQATD